jgi:hypothetical protein
MQSSLQYSVDADAGVVCDLAVLECQKKAAKELFLGWWDIAIVLHCNGANG